MFSQLEFIKFPKNKLRREASNYGTCETMTFGKTGLNNRTWDSKMNDVYPGIYDALKRYGAFLNPDFSYTSITVNKNFQTYPHKDNNNIGMSMIIAVGNFTGGELVVGDKAWDIHDKVHYFDGSKEVHYTMPFEGTRYSIIYFTRNDKSQRIVD